MHRSSHRASPPSPRPGVCLDFPRGGTKAIVEALVRGVNKHPGCELRLNAPVERLLVEQGRAVGVQVEGGGTIRARRAVISNADLWSTSRLLAQSEAAPELAREVCRVELSPWLNKASPSPPQSLTFPSIKSHPPINKASPSHQLSFTLPSTKTHPSLQ